MLLATALSKIPLHIVVLTVQIVLEVWSVVAGSIAINIRLNLVLAKVCRTSATSILGGGIDFIIVVVASVLRAGCIFECVRENPARILRARARNPDNRNRAAEKIILKQKC